MAGFADQMVQSALTQSQKVGDGFGESVNKGAELALKAEEIQRKKEAIAQEQQKLVMAKFEKVGGWFESLSKMPEGKAKNAFSKNFIPQGIQALGLQDKINPTVLEMMQGDASLATSLRSAIIEGSLSVADLNDPAKIAKVYPDLMRTYSADQIKQSLENNPENFVKATEDRQKNLAQAAALEAQNTRQDKEIAATGRKEYAKDTAKLYANYQAAGGRAGLQKNIEAFNDAIKQLQENKIMLGSWDKKIPWGGDLDVLARTDPKAKALIDQVLGGINMRAALADPNPTEKQVATIRSQTIDPRLSNAANIKKLIAARDAMIREASDKEKAFLREALPGTEELGKPMQQPGAVAPGGNEPPQQTGIPVLDALPPDKLAAFKETAMKSEAHAAEIARRLNISVFRLMQGLAKIK